MKKRMISFVLTVAILLQTCSVMAVAETGMMGGINSEEEMGVYDDNLTWALDGDGVLTISGSGAMKNFTFNEETWFCDTFPGFGVV